MIEVARRARTSPPGSEGSRRSQDTSSHPSRGAYSETFEPGYDPLLQEAVALLGVLGYSPCERPAPRVYQVLRNEFHRYSTGQMPMEQCQNFEATEGWVWIQRVLQSAGAQAALLAASTNKPPLPERPFTPKLIPESPRQDQPTLPKGMSTSPATVRPTPPDRRTADWRPVYLARIDTPRASRPSWTTWADQINTPLTTIREAEPPSSRPAEQSFVTVASFQSSPLEV
jgi:hypothetical protein